MHSTFLGEQTTQMKMALGRFRSERLRNDNRTPTLWRKGKIRPCDTCEIRTPRMRERSNRIGKLGGGDGAGKWNSDSNRAETGVGYRPVARNAFERYSRRARCRQFTL